MTTASNILSSLTGMEDISEAITLTWGEGNTGWNQKWIDAVAKKHSAIFGKFKKERDIMVNGKSAWILIFEKASMIGNTDKAGVGKITHVATADFSNFIRSRNKATGGVKETELYYAGITFAPVPKKAKSIKDVVKLLAPNDLARDHQLFSKAMMKDIDTLFGKNATSAWDVTANADYSRIRVEYESKEVTIKAKGDGTFDADGKALKSWDEAFSLLEGMLTTRSAQNQTGAASHADTEPTAKDFKASTLTKVSAKGESAKRGRGKKEANGDLNLNPDEKISAAQMEPEKVGALAVPDQSADTAKKDASKDAIRKAELVDSINTITGLISGAKGSEAAALNDDLRVATAQLKALNSKTTSANITSSLNLVDRIVK